MTSFFQDLGLSLFMTLIPLILFPGTFLAFDVPSRFAFYSLFVYCTVYSVRQLSLAAQNTGRYLKWTGGYSVFATDTFLKNVYVNIFTKFFFLNWKPSGDISELKENINDDNMLTIAGKTAESIWLIFFLREPMMHS